MQARQTGCSPPVWFSPTRPARGPSADRTPPHPILGSQGPISESDFFTWEALIVGPKDTPFEGGVFPAVLTFVRIPYALLCKPLLMPTGMSYPTPFFSASDRNYG